MVDSYQAPVAGEVDHASAGVVQSDESAEIADEGRHGLRGPALVRKTDETNLGFVGEWRPPHATVRDPGEAVQSKIPQTEDVFANEIVAWHPFREENDEVSFAVLRNVEVGWVPTEATRKAICNSVLGEVIEISRGTTSTRIVFLWRFWQAKKS